MPKALGSKPRARAPHPEVFGLADGIAALKAGALVVYPTETFYGLGADPFAPAALKRLLAAKRREAGKPVGLIAADSEMAFSVAREVPFVARRLAEAFWPGPLTIVLPARGAIPGALLGEDGGVAVRVSSHPVARALAEGLGRPVTATSANLSGAPPATTLAQARAAFGTKVGVFLEGGTLAAAAPSTVVAVTSADWRIVRVGAISERDIAAALSPGALK